MVDSGDDNDNGENNAGGGEESNKLKERNIPPLVTDDQTSHEDDNGFLKSGNLASPSSSSARFQQIPEERGRVSRIRRRFHKMFCRKIDWSSLWKIFKEWIKEPKNFAFFVWVVCVQVSSAILFMLMIGVLNHALPKKSQRDACSEVNNQILNALFTIMTLYHHPKRIYHLALLVRWRRPDDASKLRKIYCKNGTYKPNERAHMMVLVLLLNLNCISQYAVCALTLGYKRSKRPPIAVGIATALAMNSIAIAAVYAIHSPLGKEYDYDTDIDEEAQIRVSPRPSRRISMEKRFSFASRRDDDEPTVETSPRWSGGILDFWDDVSLAILSLFCSSCVFGWNMERLGFGNMYLHIATFILFCMIPFWIFNLAAISIHDEALQVALGLTGVFLCLLGLLYGGFWRIQMRRRYNLPSYTFCCGKPEITDFALWFFCCCCSLAQEVRTGNSYDIVEYKFYPKKGKHSSPLPQQDEELGSRPNPRSPLGNINAPPSRIGKAYSLSPTRFSRENYSSDRQGEESSSRRGRDATLRPPLPSVIQRASTLPSVIQR